jgi:hypothetical protein
MASFENSTKTSWRLLKIAQKHHGAFQKARKNIMAPIEKR